MNNLSTFCYLCLRDEGEMHRLMEKDTDNILIGLKVRNSVFNKKWTPANSSASICTSCLDEVRRFYNFRNSATNHDNIVKHYISEFPGTEDIIINKRDIQNYIDSNFERNVMQETLVNINSVVTKRKKALLKTNTSTLLQLDCKSRDVSQDTEAKIYEIPVRKILDNVENIVPTLDNPSLPTRSFDLLESNYQPLAPATSTGPSRVLQTVPVQGHCSNILSPSPPRQNVNTITTYHESTGNTNTSEDVDTSGPSKVRTTLDVPNLYQCDTCFVKWPNSTSLKIHQRQHIREKISAHKCPLCHKFYRYNSCLQTHIMKHTTKKPILCQICKSKFPHISKLTKNMRIQTGNSPYLCPVCNQSFTDLQECNEHISIHAREKPFVCDLCKSNFTLEADL